MAAPTFAEAWVKTTAAINVLQKAKLFAGFTATNNLVDLIRTYEAAVKAEGNDAAQVSTAMATIRGGVNSILSNPRAILDPCVRMIARSSVINSSAPTITGQLQDIYLYMAGAAAQSVKYRNFTRGAFSSGSPFLGGGSIKRVTTDAYGFPLEASFADVITCKVIQDQNTGTLPGKEIWQFAPKPFVDFCEWGVSGRGAGDTKTFATVNSDDSIIANASFSDRGGTDALPTSITNWTSSVAVIGDGTDYQLDRTNYYRTGQKEGGSPAGLRVYLTRTLTQALSVVGASVDVTRPYYAGIAWNRQVGAWTGDVTLAMGGKSSTVTAAAQTGWQLLELPTSTTQDLWPRNWQQQAGDAIAVTATKTSGAGTYVIFDSVNIIPHYAYQGAFLLPLAGRDATNWTNEDTGTITDTEANAATAIVQAWFHQAYGFSLPAGNSPTITEPT